MTMNWIVQLMVQINGTEHQTMVCHYTHSGHSGVPLVAFHWVAYTLYNGFSRATMLTSPLLYISNSTVLLPHSIPLLNA